jgi:hypothetical protein
MRQITILHHFAVGSPTISANRFQKAHPFWSSFSISKSFQKSFNSLCRGIVHHPHVRKSRFFIPLPVSIKGNCTQNRALPFTASSPFAIPFWTKKRFIQLHQSGKTVSSIPRSHSPTDFVSHKPSSLVIPYFQYALHLRYRYANFTHRHVINKPIPFGQRHACLMKNRACRQANLCSASLAIHDFSSTNKPSSRMSTPRASESIRPSNFLKMIRTGILCKKFSLKFKQTSFFVPFCHVYTPWEGVYYYYELSQ